MAVMDHDTFSNISWHSEQDAGPAEASTITTSHGTSSSDPPPRNTRLEGGRTVEGEDANLEPVRGGEILECSVSDPHKENDGTKDAYVSYQINTHVPFPPPSDAFNMIADG